MDYLLECASHSPIVNNQGAAPADIEAEVAAGYTRIATRIHEFNPDIIVLFGTDHASTFSLSVMPPACVGLRAYALGDYDLPRGKVSTDVGLGSACISSLHEQGVDVAGSYEMQLDHGFTQLLQQIFGRYDRYPILPVFINCGSEFRMPISRVRALGDAVGAFIRDTGLRTVFMGSGGLSHDPPTPTVSENMSPDVRKRLIKGVEWTDTMLDERTAKVYAAIREYAEGRSKLKPLNPKWDTQFLEAMLSADPDRLSTYTDADIIAEGGRGGGEVRTWIAAACAMVRAAGGYQAAVDYSRTVDEWMTGMAMMHGAPAHQ